MKNFMMVLALFASVPCFAGRLCITAASATAGKQTLKFSPAPGKSPSDLESYQFKMADGSTLPITIEPTSGMETNIFSTDKDGLIKITYNNRTGLGTAKINGSLLVIECSLSQD